jgi:cytochrome P450
MRRIASGEAVPVGPLDDIFRVARLSNPIQWATAPNGTGYWLLSGYNLARRVLIDQRFGRGAAAGARAPKLGMHNPAPEAIISKDGPEHLRLRSLVSRVFSERRTADLKPFVAQLAGSLLDDMRSQQSPADFVAHVAAPLPFRVLCHILGIPAVDRNVFSSWVDALFRLSGDFDETRGHILGLAGYMTRLVASKRRNPESDLISELIKSAEDQSGITNRELVTLCLSLLMAGYESTVNQLTLCALTLMLDHSLMKSLHNFPELVPRAAEELLRLNPAAYVTFPRATKEPVSVAGTIIHPGQPVIVSLIGSNRDPSAFIIPHEIVPDRLGPPHLTFGHGAHYCLGAPLARLQVVTLLTDLVKRFPDLRLAEDATSLHWKTDMALRGLTKMYVCW